MQRYGLISEMQIISNFFAKISCDSKEKKEKKVESVTKKEGKQRRESERAVVTEPARKRMAEGRQMRGGSGAVLPYVCRMYLSCI